MKKLQTEILQNAFSSKEGHIPSSLSILDILWVLYSKILKVNPKKPHDPNRDYFILSKGHASLGLYSVLAEKGFFDKKKLKDFCRYESILGGHPNRNKVPGVEASTGSLGHGLPIAVGIAKGLKIQKKKQKVFVIIGDGESNEGTIWESALLASHHKLDNLCCIVDHNHSGDRALDLGNLENKFSSFGWDCMTINGHDQKEIEKALKTKHANVPLAIIAKTIKGYGIKALENNSAWHHKSPNQEEFEGLMKELS
ncbi:MAG: transketolase [Candidatus Parcubacteria bacterium]|nr:transketolase [Candidatus Parcubacteria bacterium]